MFMRFRGGGIGHVTTHHVTQRYLYDQDPSEVDSQEEVVFEEDDPMVPAASAPEGSSLEPAAQNGNNVTELPDWLMQDPDIDGAEGDINHGADDIDREENPDAQDNDESIEDEELDYGYQDYRSESGDHLEKTYLVVCLGSP